MSDSEDEIENKLDIETISLKFDKRQLARLKALASEADMDLEPFIRRLCADTVDKSEQTTSQTTAKQKKFDWGDVRSVEPINNDFGFSSGQPIDRYYIDQFLDQHRGDIRGHVLEIADNNYTLRFGDDRVEKSDILHVQKSEKATLVADLETGQGIPADSFDCIILTQTLPFIYDDKSVIANCHKALRKDGVLLCTVNGISQISSYDMERWGDFWRFTDLSLRRLIAESFDKTAVSISTFGNVLAATSFLMGLPAQALKMRELDHHDKNYQVLIAARTQKP